MANRQTNCYAHIGVTIGGTKWQCVLNLEKWIGQTQTGERRNQMGIDYNNM